MTFRTTHIAAAAGLAVAASASMAAPQGQNVDLSNYVSGPGVTDIYVAGSSAVDLALTKFIANSCLPSTLDTYRTDAGGKTYYLWTCETSSGTGFNLASGNTKIAIHKNTNSSSDGVNGVANGAAPLAYLQVSDLNTASACTINPQVIPGTPTIPQYNYFSCGTTAGAAGVGTLSHVDRFGFSDSEPKQFNAAVASQLTSVYPLTIVFGVPVSLNVRNLLQTAQGLVSNSETEANMPSLTTGQLNAIFTGKFSTWPQLGLASTGFADNNIYFVRRSAGSGTTRAFDATFVTDFCIPGAAPIVTVSVPQLTSPTTQCVPGTRGQQAGTSDDMASCIATYNSQNVGSIGYLSTDYQPQAGDGYRWIKVDGYAPKLLNVADGKWRDWSEEALNYNTATPLTGDDSSFYAAIRATSINGELMSELAQNLPQATSGQWTGGVMGALPTRGNGPALSPWGLSATSILGTPRTDASVLAFPANPATRYQSTTSYNLCNVAVPVTNYSAE